MHFVGRIAQLQELRANAGEGVSSLLIGGRRAGKTELIKRLPDADRRWIVLDAGSWDITSEAGALRAFGKALGASGTDRDTLAEALAGGPAVCVVVDEADRILGEPWCESFLAWLRALDGNGAAGLMGHVSFVLAGGPNLRRYEQPDTPGSPALNNARFVFLSALSSEEVGERLRADGLTHDVGAVRVLVGGQPWLLDHLCRFLKAGSGLDEAADLTLQQVEPRFPTWKHQLGSDAVDHMLSLPPAGVAAAEYRRSGPRARHQAARLTVSYLALERKEADDGRDLLLPGPALFLDWLRKAPADIEWDLAISYTSEDEELARTIHGGLTECARVFYAPHEHAWLWGQDLSRVLPNTYGVRARRVLVLCSATYLQRHWTLLEYQAARSGGAEILLISIDALPDDFPTEIVYYRATRSGLVTLLDTLRARLR